MSEPTSSETTTEKPVLNPDDTKFPPFPDPTDDDFDEDISDEERIHYKSKFSDLNSIKTLRLHCTACDRHLGCSARNDSRMRTHPMLRTLVCHTCHTFYNSGEFDKGDDGSELYCRWCGQGGQVYCCSDCPHVFCAKCIKRNLGQPKIKEIENTDDWKCFKCNNKCLWDLRAVCWALLRYCDLKNQITYKTEDPILKEAYQKDCAIDHTECCKSKTKRKEKQETTRKKEEKVEYVAKKSTTTVLPKIPPTIQVRKFASINLEESVKTEKKGVKRSASPKIKPVIMKNPLSLAPTARLINPMSLPPTPKKMRMQAPQLINPVRISNMERTKNPNMLYTRVRPKAQYMPPIPIMPSNQFNGFNNSPQFPNLVINDNINLSLESLTQGLDMSAVAAMANNPQNDDVVCTPDLPLEPLCEVSEDNADDDVQCITPGPVAAPKLNTPPPLVPRTTTALSDLSSDNIIQMTENDVTVNAATGGLKFRVDPQTLSSNKMYRLPDGRIFAINSNPNMPGGYSATIVAVTDNAAGKAPPKGATYAAKLSAVLSTPNTNHTPPAKQSSTPASRNTRRKANVSKAKKAVEPPRECDLNVPVEWFRYNLIDAVDALEYSLPRLQKLKKEATTMHLRTRSINEIRTLHRTLERLLNTSASRLHEIKDNLNKDLRQYLLKKMDGNTSDDDDDVEILPNSEAEDPIFIDENSVESNANCNETQEVDLTCRENLDLDKNDRLSKALSKDRLVNSQQESFSGVNEISRISSSTTTNEESVLINDSNEQDNLDKTDHVDVNDHELQSKEKNSDGDNQTDNKKHQLKEIKKDEESSDVCDPTESLQKDDEQNHTKVVKKDDYNGDAKHDSKDDKKDNVKGEEKHHTNSAVKEDERDTSDDVKDDVETDLQNSESKIDSELQDVMTKQKDEVLNNYSVLDTQMKDISENVKNSVDSEYNDAKMLDQEISEEMIEDLLKDDGADDVSSTQNLNCLDISDIV